jgi:hypothetical protein
MNHDADEKAVFSSPIIGILHSFVSKADENREKGGLEICQ